MGEVEIDRPDNVLFDRQPRQLDHRTDLDRAPAGHGDPRGDVDRLVEIPGLDHEKTAQLLAGLRERAVGDQPLAAPDLDAGRQRRREERRGGEELSGGVELVRELRGVPVALVPLARGEGVLVAVDEGHVAHEEPPFTPPPAPRRAGQGSPQRPPFPPPARPPMIMNGPAPAATAPGSGASGGSWEMASSQA